MMASMLISLHNINFYQQFMSEIRKNIKMALLLLFTKNILIILINNYLKFFKYIYKREFL